MCVFQGVLSVFDPPRIDTKATIEAAYANGVEVKMITGDQTAIAVETCRMLGMGTKVWLCAQSVCCMWLCEHNHLSARSTRPVGTEACLCCGGIRP
jgi:magnesium-transporting ATPase (P-type)